MSNELNIEVDGDCELKIKVNGKRMNIKKDLDYRTLQQIWVYSQNVMWKKEMSLMLIDPEVLICGKAVWDTSDFKTIVIKQKHIKAALHAHFKQENIQIKFDFWGESKYYYYPLYETIEFFESYIAKRLNVVVL